MNDDEHNEWDEMEESFPCDEIQYNTDGNDLNSKAEQLIQDALQGHLEKVAIKKYSKKKDSSRLKGVVGECLETFLILGYNYNGEPVQVVSAQTQQQADALGTTLHRFLVKNTNIPGNEF